MFTTALPRPEPEKKTIRNKSRESRPMREAATDFVKTSLVFCGALSCPKQLTTEHHADPHMSIKMAVFGHCSFNLLRFCQTRFRKWDFFSHQVLVGPLGMS
jgi:hypothetical protein